jgi:hypothetical protein
MHEALISRGPMATTCRKSSTMAGFTGRYLIPPQTELVGGAITILKNMKVSWDDYPIYSGKNKIQMFQTTNQRDRIHHISHHISQRTSGVC